jgi:hypothetical protein
LARWAGASSRIVDLGLRRRVDPALGNDVTITIAARQLRR